MAQAKIDVGDGTLIAPPPHVETPAPTAPPPAVPPTAPLPPVAPTTKTPIVLPGQAFIDQGDIVGSPDLIPAPPATGSDNTEPGSDGNPTVNTDDEPSARGPSLFDFGPPYTGEEISFDYNPPLEGQAFVAAVRRIMAEFDIDPAAALINAQYEGHGGTIGDGGEAYGPWQDWMTYFKGRPWYGKGKYNNQVNYWAWSEDGITYAARSMSKTKAKGETGPQAAWDIAYWYEKPTNRVGDANTRKDALAALLDNQTGIWDFFAGQMKGPSGWTGSQTVPAPTTTTTTSVGNLGVMATWRDLITVLRSDVPGAGTYCKNIADQIVKAVA